MAYKLERRCECGKISLFHGTFEKNVVPTKILDFQEKNVLSWLAELMKHRDAADSKRYRMLSKKFIEKYGIDTEEYDVIKGWRANASYFYIAKSGEKNMRAYAEAYLNDVVENQGKLFDFVTQSFPDKDTEEFINTYMKSKTRKSIDEAQAYVNTMDVKELWKYFLETDHYALKSGEGLKGFMPDWIGEFYAYYQWYYNISSSEVIKKVPVEFLKKAYYGLHDLELEFAVKKVGEVYWI